MEPCELKPGDIVQIDPEHDKRFAGCLMVVSEPKPWGAQGYVRNAGSDGRAYYRCEWANMEFTGGSAVWVAGSEFEDSAA